MGASARATRAGTFPGIVRHVKSVMSKSDFKGETKVRKCWIILAVLSLVVPAGSASAAGKGGSMLSIGLGQGVADGYASAVVGAGGYLAPNTRPETNAGLEYWYSFSDDYAMALSGAYGFSSMKWEGAAAADPEIKATGKSFKVRLGGDRMGKVGDRLTVFMGPGIEYWNGKEKLKVGSTETESKSVSRFGVSGRIGGFMMLTETVGIMGQVGHTFGFASVKDGAKTTWMPSSFNASWGLSFGF